MAYENESKYILLPSPSYFFLLRGKYVLTKKSNRPAGLLNLSIHLMFARCLHRSCGKDKILIFLFILFSHIIHVVFAYSEKYRREWSRARRASCFSALVLFISVFFEETDDPLKAHFLPRNKAMQFLSVASILVLLVIPRFWFLPERMSQGVFCRT